MSERNKRRRGMTLLELVIAGTIMTLVAATLGALAMSVEQTFAHTTGQGLAAQHARVTQERIERALVNAHANEVFPGFAVFEDKAGEAYFPHNLVVWRPNGAAADPLGLPRFNEIVVFAPHSDEPNRLLEITAPGDTRQVPALDDVASWLSEIEALKSQQSSNIIELSHLVRRRPVAEDSDFLPGSTRIKAAVRFTVTYSPSLEDWQQYKAGSLSWDELAWPQGLRGESTGVRRCWCQMEIQFAPTSSEIKDLNNAQNAVPCFGSGSVYYDLQR